MKRSSLHVATYALTTGALLTSVLISGVLVTPAAHGQSRAAKARVLAEVTPAVVQRPSSARLTGNGVPLQVLISLRAQRLSLYHGSELVATAPISSGREGYETPTGVFSILQKNRDHESNIYDNAPMPFMQRLTWSGIALHAGALPGYRASHGCVRMPYSFAQRLFSTTPMGTRVIVSDHELDAPREIKHALLFAALPPGGADDELPNVSFAIPPAPRPGSSAVPALSAAPSAASPISVEAKPPVLTTGSIWARLLGQGIAPVGASPATAAPSLEVAAATGFDAGAGPGVGLSLPDAGPQPDGSAAAQIEPPRTLAEVARRRAAAITRLEAAIGRAEDERDGAAVALRGAERDAEAAAALVAQMVSAVRYSQSEVKSLLAEQAAVSRELARLIRSAEAEEMTPTAIEEASALEEAYEARLLAILEEIADIEADIEASGTVIAAARDAARERLDVVAAAREDVRSKTAAVASAVAEHKEALREEKRHTLPVTVLISRRTGKVHVRQGFRDLIVAPVEIEMPDRPLGTHIFTAGRFAPDQQSLRWTVVTVDSGGSAPARTAAVLDRITVPAHVRQIVAEVVKPSSTVMISDLPPSNETGKYTDYILLTPQ